jgi:hypothetical protein
MADSQEKDQIAELAGKRYQASFDYCTPYFDRFIDNYKHYYLRIIDEAVEKDPEAYPFYSQTSLPVSYQIVETLLPRMFGRMPSFSIKTEEQNDENDEKSLENLIKYQMNHPYLVDDPVYARLVSAAKEMFIAGNAWGSVPWMMKEAEVQEWQPYSVQLGIMEPSWDNLEKIKYYGVQPDWKLVTVKKRVIDSPVFQHENIFHVFPDPKKKRVSDLGWAIVERKMSPSELVDMINISPSDYDPEKLKQLLQMFKDKSWGTANKDDYDTQMASIFGSTDISYNDSTTGEGQFKVWMMREPGKTSIIVNESLTIRTGPNENRDNKIGLILMKDIPVPHELFAWGEIDPIKKIEDAMTDQLNMRSDSIFYDLLRMWKLDPTSLVDGEEFLPEPGVVVQMKEMDGLQPLETGSTKPTAFKEYSEWDAIVQGTTGITDYATGSSDPGMNKTMGGVQLLQQAASARFSMKLLLFESLGLKAMGTMYVQRNMMFFDRPQNINTGTTKETITPDQIRRIRGVVHFVVDAGSTEAVNKSQNMTKWNVLQKMLGKPPFENLTPKALEAWGEKILYSMDEIDVQTLNERNPVVPAPVLDAAGNPAQTVPAGAPGEVVPGAVPEPPAPPILEPAPTVEAPDQIEVPTQNVE